MHERNLHLYNAVVNATVEASGADLYRGGPRFVPE
jgi:hypothetical protein